MKKQKGITLIALVITIIVMLILVGVTISVSLNGGLFTTAKEATAETQREKEKEELLMAALGALNQNGEVDISKLDSSLPEGFTGNNGQYTSKTGNVFTVTEDGTITLVGEESGEEPETPVTPPATPTITITPETITEEIESGTATEVGTITATVTNVDGDLTWSITPTNSGLELVDTDNANVKKIKASKAVENARITVSYGSVSDTCSVTITEKATTLISFTIEGKTYYAKENSTFEEWANDPRYVNGAVVWDSWAIWLPGETSLGFHDVEHPEDGCLIYSVREDKIVEASSPIIEGESYILACEQEEDLGSGDDF